MRKENNTPKRTTTPLKIALIYAIVGILWILFSDILVVQVFKDPLVIRRISIEKGWFYVAATAWMLYALIKRDLTAIQDSEEAVRRSEEHKKDFYRRTIMAATQGKLVITEKPQIYELAGPPIETWKISAGEDLSIARNGAARIADSEGMEESRIFDFVLCIGEATTNAFKHAGGGTASVHKIPGGLMAIVTDEGPGIEALVLPELALVRGYTTAESLGMGYKAMISIADRIYLATGPEGTTVGIDMLLQPPPAETIPTYLPDTWKYDRIDT